MLALHPLSTTFSDKNVSQQQTTPTTTPNYDNKHSGSKSAANDNYSPTNITESHYNVSNSATNHTTTTTTTEEICRDFCHGHCNRLHCKYLHADCKPNNNIKTYPIQNCNLTDCKLVHNINPNSAALFDGRSNSTRCQNFSATGNCNNCNCTEMHNINCRASPNAEECMSFRLGWFK